MEPNLGAAARPRPTPPVPPVDRDPKARPGYPKERAPEPWPNARPHPQPMTARPAVPTHGRPGKTLPPVYGTAVPLHGLSGLIRRAAYRLPDHVTSHWTLLLLGDRVDAWTRRAKRLLWIAVPGVGVFLLARAVWRDA